MKRWKPREAKGLTQGYKVSYRVPVIKRSFSVSGSDGQAVTPSSPPHWRCCKPVLCQSLPTPHQLTILNMTTTDGLCVPEEECEFCDDKMTLLKLQLRKINSGNTALGEDNCFSENVFQQKYKLPAGCKWKWQVSLQGAHRSQALPSSLQGHFTPFIPSAEPLHSYLSSAPLIIQTSKHPNTSWLLLLLW